MGKAPPKKVPKTLENMREKDETMVVDGDEEVMNELEMDEFSAHFRGQKRTKIVFTTSPKPSRQMFPVVKEMMSVFPKTTYVARRNYHVKEIVKYSSEKKYTHVLILQERHRKPVGLYVIHLPRGPTAYFKLTSFVPGANIPGHGVRTKHKPEVVLRGFSTRLGVTVGRMLGSLFPSDPDFGEGGSSRNVVTFLCQRDFIFFRSHRYIFDVSQDSEGVRLQEIGPRFTLRLKWLQDGTFDTRSGEFEWVAKKETKGRKAFFL